MAKKRTLAIRNSWNGATYGLRTPVTQASVSSPGWRSSCHADRAARASMLVNAWRAFSASPRSVRSRGGKGSSPQRAQNGVVTVTWHAGQTQLRSVALPVDKLGPSDDREISQDPFKRAPKGMKGAAIILLRCTAPVEAGGVLLHVLRQRADALRRRSDRSILLQIGEDVQSLDGRSVEPLHGDLQAFVSLRLADPLEPVHATKIVVVDLVQLADHLVSGSGRRDDGRDFAWAEQVHRVPLVRAVPAGHATAGVDVLVGEAP